jgi:hypothetical protein
MNQENQNKFTRNCPSCNKIIIYTRKDSLNLAEKKKCRCKSCSFKDREYPLSFGEKMKQVYKNMSPEQKIKRAGMTGKKHTKSTKEKMTLSAKNKKLSPNFNGRGRQFVWNDEYKQIFSEKSKNAWKNPSIRKKYQDAISRTNWLRVRCDDGQLELLNKWNRLGFNFEPNYQLKDDNFFYYLDGYDKEKNIVLEFDSEYHNKPSQKKKDIMRQQNIIKVLNPKKFWRYNLKSKTFKNVVEEIQ